MPLVPLFAFFFDDALPAMEAALRSFLRWRHTRYLCEGKNTKIKREIVSKTILRRATFARRCAFAPYLNRARRALAPLLGLGLALQLELGQSLRLVARRAVGLLEAPPIAQRVERLAVRLPRPRQRLQLGILLGGLGLGRLAPLRALGLRAGDAALHEGARALGDAGLERHVALETRNLGSQSACGMGGGV